MGTVVTERRDWPSIKARLNSWDQPKLQSEAKQSREADWPQTDENQVERATSSQWMMKIYIDDMASARRTG